MNDVHFPEFDDVNDLLRGQWSNVGNVYTKVKNGTEYKVIVLEIANRPFHLTAWLGADGCGQLSMPSIEANLLAMALSEFIENHGQVNAANGRSAEE